MSTTQKNIVTLWMGLWASVLGCACQPPMTQSSNARHLESPASAASAPVQAPAQHNDALAVAPKPVPAGKAGGKMPPGALKMTEATTVYHQRCALCHGAKGQGDGVAAVNLRPQPRSFAVAEWQEATSDEAIMEIIVKGGKAVGRSMMMPPARDLEGQTELLFGLVAVVRNFGPGGAKAAPQ